MVVEAIPDAEEGMPRMIDHDPSGGGSLVRCPGDRIGQVSQDLWGYSVNRMPVVKKWFGYRKSEPAGRRSSLLDDINPTT